MISGKLPPTLLPRVLIDRREPRVGDNKALGSIWLPR
jgi:hypothetical protein